MQTRFLEKKLAKLEPGEWTDERYPNLKFRVGKKARTWVYRPPRLPDGTRPGGKLGRYPDLNLEEAVKMYEGEKGRIARGEPHTDPEKEIEELQAKLRALKRAAGKFATFGSLAERFLAEYVPRSQRPLATKTRQRYEQLLRDYALPHWAGLDVDEIEEADIEDRLNEIKEAGAPFAARHLLKLLKTMYRFALKKKIATRNPCAEIPKIRDNVRVRVLEAEEIGHVWRAYSELPHEYGNPLKLLVLTWQRRSEVAGLPWSEIRGDWWHNERAKRTNGLGLPRLVYLGSLAREVLEIQRASSNGKIVFPGIKSKERPVRADVLTQKNREISDRLLEEGEIQAPFTVHDLRRTATTKARAQGVDRRVAKTILGHSSSSVTDIYDLYSMQPEIEQALKSWDSYLTDLLRPGAD